MSRAQDVATVRRGQHSVHLAPGHRADDARVMHKEARTLVEAGWQVTVVVPHERNEVLNGVRIAALPVPAGRARRFILNQPRLLLVAWRADGDVYHVHDIDALPAGLVMRLRRRHLIVDSHEDYPLLAMSRSWLPRPLRGVSALAIKVLERVASSAATAVISAESQGAIRFPESKVTVLRNAVMDEEFDILGNRAPHDGEFRVVYVGAMSKERGVGDAIEAVPAEVAGTPVTLVLLGDLSRILAEVSTIPGWGRAEAPGHVGRPEVLQVLASAHLGLLLFRPTRHHVERVVPVKLFEYMAAGLPVVATDLPLQRSIISTAGCGLLVSPQDPSEAREAIAELLSDPARAASMGEQGREYVRQNFLWSNESPGLLEIYRGISGA